MPMHQHVAAAAHAVLSDTVPLVVSRQLLTAFAHSIAQLPPEPQKEVAEKCASTVPALVCA